MVVWRDTRKPISNRGCALCNEIEVLQKPAESGSEVKVHADAIGLTFDWIFIDLQ